MAYKTVNDKKHERKIGLEAAKKLRAAPDYDAQAVLAVARQNLDAFSQLDELPDAAFVDAMREFRAQKPDLYAIFWWWRAAEEDAGRGREDEVGDKSEPRYRFFKICQFLAEPFSDDWEDDRLTLKPGIEPWITDQQIQDGLQHKSIKGWSWIWHCRDFYTEEDEITDREGLRKAGDRKFLHAHIALEIPAKVPRSTVARWFKVPVEVVKPALGRGAFLDMVEYFLHESPKAVAQGKTPYDDDELHVMPGFDFRRALADLQSHRAKYGKRAGEMSPADTMRLHVMDDGWTMAMCREDDPLTYSKIRNALPPLRLDYFLSKDPCPFRLNIYVDGPGGVGKSAFSEYIAQAMFPSYDKPYFCVGNDDRVTFDGYDGEPVVIWDDMRVTDFIRQFGSNGTYRLLDPFPKLMSQQAKHSRVVLYNAVNIINGVQPYADFINGLAGTYKDRNGDMHEAEDDTQAWRRIPIILCVREGDFDVLINKGFVDDDMRAIKTMQLYANVRGSLKSVMQRLGGAAKEEILLEYGKPVIEASRLITGKQDGKITEIDEVPDDLRPVVLTGEALDEARQEEMFRFVINTIQFVDWFVDQYAPAHNIDVRMIDDVRHFYTDDMRRALRQYDVAGKLRALSVDTIRSFIVSRLHAESAEEITDEQMYATRVVIEGYLAAQKLKTES